MGEEKQPGQWERIDLIHRTRLPAADKAVLVAVAKHGRRRVGVCFAAVSTMARETGFSRKTVGKVITRLADAGVLVELDRVYGRAPTLEIDWETVRLMGLREEQTQVQTCEKETQVDSGAVQNVVEESSTCEPPTKYLRTCEGEPAKIPSEPAKHSRPNSGPPEPYRPRAFEGLDSGIESSRASSDDDVKTFPVVENPARQHAFQISQKELEERSQAAAEARQHLPIWLRRALDTEGPGPSQLESVHSEQRRNSGN